MAKKTKATASAPVGRKRKASQGASEDAAPVTPAQKLKQIDRKENRSAAPNLRSLAEGDENLQNALMKIDENQVLKAIVALKQHYKINQQRKMELEKASKTAKKSLLFSEDEIESGMNAVNFELSPIEPYVGRLFNVVVQLAHLDDEKLTTITANSVKIPFPMVKPNKELRVCLIVPSDMDRDRCLSFKDEALDEASEAEGMSNEVKDVFRCLKRVISYPELIAMCQNQIQKRRELNQQYDLFLCDFRCLKEMPSVLGRNFLSGQKRILPVALYDRKLDPSAAPERKTEDGKIIVSMKKQEKKNINLDLKACADTLREVIESVWFSIRSKGSSLRFGRLGMSDDELKSNFFVVISKVVGEYVESKWDNVMSINMQLGESVSLPVFNQIAGKDNIDKDDPIDPEQAKDLAKLQEFKQYNAEKKKRLGSSLPLRRKRNPRAIKN